MILCNDYAVLKKTVSDVFNGEPVYIDGLDVVFENDPEGLTRANLQVVGPGRLQITFIKDYQIDPDRKFEYIDVPGADFEPHER